jgi:hypothetical protein
MSRRSNNMGYYSYVLTRVIAPPAGTGPLRAPHTPAVLMVSAVRHEAVRCRMEDWTTEKRRRACRTGTRPPFTLSPEEEIRSRFGFSDRRSLRALGPEAVERAHEFAAELVERKHVIGRLEQLADELLLRGHLTGDDLERLLEAPTLYRGRRLWDMSARHLSVRELDDVWDGRLQRVSVFIPRVPWHEAKEEDDEDDERVRGTRDAEAPRSPRAARGA